MKYVLIIIGFLCVPHMVDGQDGSFTISIDKDTIFQDEMIKIEFMLDNLSGKFIPPTFVSFSIVSGPNTSSSYSIFNGQSSQKKSYTYMLIPNKSGPITIGQAVVENINGIITSEPITLFVLEKGIKPIQSSPNKRVFRYQASGLLELDTIKTKTKRVLKKF